MSETKTTEVAETEVEQEAGMRIVTIELDVTKSVQSVELPRVSTFMPSELNYHNLRLEFLADTRTQPVLKTFYLYDLGDLLDEDIKFLSKVNPPSASGPTWKSTKEAKYLFTDNDSQ